MIVEYDQVFKTEKAARLYLSEEYGGDGGVHAELYERDIKNKKVLSSWNNFRSNQMKDMTLMEFLRFLSKCSGDEAIEIISKFQSGAITVAGISADEFDNGEPTT